MSRHSRRHVRAAGEAIVLVAITVLVAASAPASDRPTPGPKEPLTLDAARELALAANPRLVALSTERLARIADVEQAGRRPNPELGVEVENLATRRNGAETTVGLSQRIELGGKRDRRRHVASRDRHLSDVAIEAARRETIAEVTRAFTAVLAAEENVAVAGDLVGVAEEVLTAVARRVEAGSVSTIEASRARVALETSRIDHEQARRALTAARHRLAATWGDTTAITMDLTGDLEALSSVEPLDVLRARVGDAPAVRTWSAELAHRRAALALARAEGVPDLTLGAGIRYAEDPGDASLIVQLGIPLPLFDRNTDRSRAAAFELQAAEERRRAATVSVTTELAVSYAHLRAAELEVITLRDEVIPSARAAFAAAREAYLRGPMRLTDVLDAERTLYELRRRYVTALVRHHDAIADIHRLVGPAMPGDADTEVSR